MLRFFIFFLFFRVCIIYKFLIILLFARYYVRADMILTCDNHLNHRIISLRGKVCVNKTRLVEFRSKKNKNIVDILYRPNLLFFVWKKNCCLVRRRMCTHIPR